MELNPRYSDKPIIAFADDGDIVAATIRQRERLAATLTTLTDAQWAHPSRCEGWTVRDVISHLEGTNGFWTISVASALAGEPTEILSSFDPVRTPQQMVEAGADDSADVIFDRFLQSNEALTATIAGLTTSDLDVLAEAPPGHASVSAVLHHALWDAWIHERDVMLPLGLDPVCDPVEVTACLRYAVALNAGFAIVNGLSVPGGTLAVEATDPDVAFGIEVGETALVTSRAPADAAVSIAGDAVEMVEGLSCRAPLDVSLPPEHAWLLAGVAQVFEQS